MKVEYNINIKIKTKKENDYDGSRIGRKSFRRRGRIK